MVPGGLADCLEIPMARFCLVFYVVTMVAVAILNAAVSTPTPTIGLQELANAQLVIDALNS
jgi:hypothetical protein